MKFTAKRNPGEKFEKKWFAFWPVKISNETRWLETVKVWCMIDDNGKVLKIRFKD